MQENAEDEELGGTNPVPKNKGKVSFVTGASGRLGKELIKVLIKRGDTVRALVNRKDSIIHLPSGTIPFVGDINDSAILNDACKGVDNVFHLAAIVSEYKVNPMNLMRINVDGTRNVLEACEDNAVSHFIFPSSVDVYGYRRNEILNEDSSLDPQDKYGVSKMLAEQIIQRYKSTVPSTIFRIAVMYGPGFEEQFFKFFDMVRLGKARIIGDGTNTLNLVHVYDVMQAFILASTSKKSIGNVYNLTDGEFHTQRILFNLAADMLKVPRVDSTINRFIAKVLLPYVKINPDEYRFLTSNRQIDISRIKAQLGYKPIVKLDSGAMEMFKTYEKKMKSAKHNI